MSMANGAKPGTNSLEHFRAFTTKRNGDFEVIVRNMHQLDYEATRAYNLTITATVRLSTAFLADHWVRPSFERTSGAESRQTSTSAWSSPIATTRSPSSRWTSSLGRSKRRSPLAVLPPSPPYRCALVELPPAWCSSKWNAQALDADAAGSPASAVTYRILDSGPAHGLFSINSHTGDIYAEARF